MASPTHCLVFAVCVMMVMVVDCSERMLSGYHFLDNQLEDRFGPDNGYATYDTGVPIPDQVILLSNC